MWEMSSSDVGEGVVEILAPSTLMYVFLLLGGEIDGVACVGNLPAHQGIVHQGDGGAGRVQQNSAGADG